MYERNAIVIERYFSQLFGYSDKNNLKNNYENYMDLVNKIEEYQEATEKEDIIIAEYDQIVNTIKEIQRNQDFLYKKNLKMQENRKEIFENIDENVDELKRKLDKLEDELQKNNEEMKGNGESYINELAEFNEKSISRNQCSKNRRIVEENYQRQLRETVNNINGIKQEKVEEVKNFFKSENNIQEEILNKVVKNGEKEKIPFDLRVIEKSIEIQTDIEEKETEILCSVYDKVHRLFAEIKSDSIKLEKHKKVIKDSRSKLNFLNAMKDYLTLFLDNERLNIVGGEKEHKKLMDEACKNMEKDLVEITNLYTLLTKEISGRATKKLYKDLYHPEYLYDLEEQEKEFESNISRLNVIGTVIYPDYWRIEGMQKIFSVFKDSVENVYEKDLSEYEPITAYRDKIDKSIIQDGEFDEYDDIKYDEDEDEDEDENNADSEADYMDNDYDEEDDEDEDEEDNEEIEDIDSNENKDETENSDEKEREIDQILGFYNFDNDIEDEDEEDDDDDIEEDDEDEDEEDEEESNDIDNEIEDEDQDDYEYGFDEDDGYDDIDFDEDEDETEDSDYEKNEKVSKRNKKK